MKAKCILLSLFLLSLYTVYAQESLDVAPGKDRWSIKTSADISKKAKNVNLNTLLQLPLLDNQYTNVTYPDKLIPKSPGNGLKEGDMITTKGYLHLVALERSSADKSDGDYHIQLTLSPDWGDSCFIVEIPYADFISSDLKDSSVNNRTFISTKLTKGKTPSTSGSIMQHPVYVKVSGQLFYDAIHANTMRNADPSKNIYRGKSGSQSVKMHSYTAWEIHPVTHIEFAKAPKS